MSTSPAEFYKTMYADTEGWWHATAIDTDRAWMLGTFPISNGPEAMLSAVESQNGEGLYVTAAACADTVSGGRTTGEDARLIPFLWLDADAVHGVHKTDAGLLQDLDHLKTLLAGFPLSPTAVVDSGGGWYPIWKLAEPIDAQDDGRLLLDRWQTTWTRIADESGVHLDNTADLPRLLRMVGSVNTKFPEGSRPTVQVIFLNASRQYGFDELDEVLDMPEVRPQRVELNPTRAGDDYSITATVRDLEGLLAEIGMGSFRRA